MHYRTSAESSRPGGAPAARPSSAARRRTQGRRNGAVPCGGRRRGARDGADAGISHSLLLLPATRSPCIRSISHVHGCAATEPHPRSVQGGSPHHPQQTAPSSWSPHQSHRTPRCLSASATSLHRGALGFPRSLSTLRTTASAASSAALSSTRCGAPTRSSPASSTAATRTISRPSLSATPRPEPADQ